MINRKPVLMIHDMREEFLSLPLENYTLTFDDGLYSQWHFLPQLERINTDKVFFISTGFICDGEQSHVFPNSQLAHDKGRAGQLEDFMTIDQIKQIIKTPNCFVGGHGHQHVRLNELTRRTDQIKIINSYTRTMLAEFANKVGITPDRFCFPYNEELNGLYAGILRTFGFTEFYGRGRIAVESLV